MYQRRMFANINYDPEFKKFREAYPRRNSTMRWSEAYSIWQQALSQGVKVDDMVNGAKRYAQACEKSGSIGTHYVMQPATFLAEGEFLNDFLSDEEVKETEWQKACRIARERGLEPFKGHPHETQAQFIERVSKSNVVKFG